MAWDFHTELARYGPAFTARGVRPSLSFARAYCHRVARSHYENFTVASILLPRRLVPHFYAVYAYCRWSDDLADETSGTAEALHLLNWWRNELHACVRLESVHPVMIALAETIERFRIPAEPFLDLLSAFEQDQRITRYDTFDQLLDYCRRSANPVGRLVLHLFGYHDEQRGTLSDEVCAGLQLANFWQDVARDFRKGRVYLPAEDRDRFGVTPDDLAKPSASPAFLELLRFEAERTSGFFQRGRGLLPLLPSNVRGQVELFIRGGEETLAAIAANGFDVLSRRPSVNKWTKAKLIGRGLLSRLFPN